MNFKQLAERCKNLRVPKLDPKKLSMTQSKRILGKVILKLRVVYPLMKEAEGALESLTDYYFQLSHLKKELEERVFPEELVQRKSRREMLLDELAQIPEDELEEELKLIKARRENDG